jgi:FkbM family methyltransferase
MLKAIVRRLPTKFINAMGQLQFKLPFLKPLFHSISQKVISGESVIVNGIGAGLKFDATGGYAGYVLGTTEPDEQEELAKHLKSGHVFYDLGANIGFYATIAARIVGKSGRVYAFEPFPTSVAAIQKNAALNNFTNVEVFSVAVGDKAGETTFFLAENSAKHSLLEVKDGQGKGIPVQIVALDTYIAEKGLRPPDVMMIDIEGAEILAMNGMIETIAKHKPIILCEVHWLVDEVEEFIKRVLDPLGYSCTNLSGEPLPKEPIRYHLIMVPKK